VAQGNDYTDYYETQGNEEEMHIINKWKWGLSGPVATTIIIIISVLLCGICGASCFYKHRLNRDQEPPFQVCTFCPNFLFPVMDYRRMLEEQRRLAMEEGSSEDSKE